MLFAEIQSRDESGRPALGLRDPLVDDFLAPALRGGSREWRGAGDCGVGGCLSCFSVLESVA